MIRLSGPKRDDRGATLVLALVLVVVLSVVAIGIATYASANLTRVQLTEQRIDRVNAANSGIRYTIEQLRMRSNLCATRQATSGLSFDVPQQINGYTVRVTCSRAGGTQVGVNGYALVLTGETANANPWATTQGGSGSNPKKITGPIYVASADKTRFDFSQADLYHYRGDWEYYSANCATAPASAAKPDDLIMDPSGDYMALCNASSWEQVVDAPGLPPIGVTRTGPVPGPNGCDIYLPGKYTGIAVDLTRDSYFASGNYYFENSPINVKGVRVIGGKPKNGTAQVPTITTSPCSAVTDAQASLAAAAAVPPQTADGVGGSGAAWILGGTSNIQIDANGILEIFRRSDDAVTSNWSVIAAGSSTGGYVQSNPGDCSNGTAPCLLETKPGSNAALVIWGGFYGPRGLLSFGNVSNDAPAQFRGGLVASHVILQASASASGFVIAVDTAPFYRQLILRSEAVGPGSPVVATAVVQIANDDTSRLPAINSWRVNAE